MYGQGKPAESAPQGDATASPSQPMELLFAASALVFGVAMLIGARNIHVRNETGGIDPRSWPTIIALGILAAAGWALFNAITRRRAERDVEPSTRSGLMSVLIIVALIAIVLVAWQLGLSFLVLAPVFIISVNLALGLRGVLPLVAFPAVLTTVLYLVFQLLLKVPL